MRAHTHMWRCLYKSIWITFLRVHDIYMKLVPGCGALFANFNLLIACLQPTSSILEGTQWKVLFFLTGLACITSKDAMHFSCIGWLSLWSHILTCKAFGNYVAELLNVFISLTHPPSIKQKLYILQCWCRILTLI